ncbi:proline reductase-associated electron transfer protein PrdC [Sporolactobacillus terrae]|uniref:proline reductase-associated electron transfer protein PrdC n=1 Tax=Sporolactobacillus terrae TaxID=269673 RepID=UPI00048CDAD4|nr:proline reductase-associated electron transfer protein PrdC [Sporolactobacillus terrae]
MSEMYKLLLKQGMGKPAIPCVKAGESVKRGHCIATADGLGADLHASVAGTVIQVTDEAIFIRGEKSENSEFEIIPPGNIGERVRSAGIVGMGGAGFPTWIKLAQKIPGGTVIANAAECEPILAHNIAEIERGPNEVYRGLLYAMESVDAAHGVIAVKAKHKKAIARLKTIIQDDRVSVFQLEDRYPVGEKRALIRDVLGVLLAPDERTVHANAIVLNSETLSRVSQAVELGRPVLSKNLTIAGKLRRGPKSVTLMDVPIGTRIGDLIESVGGMDRDYGEVITGGPFMSQRVTLDDVVTKTTGAMIVTMPFLKAKAPLGLLVCACSASEARMKEIADQMGADVAASERCKHAVEVHGVLRCRNPGICPGQADRVLRLKKAGAQALLIGNCSDCSNTVMALAPKLNLPVHHVTDSALRAMNLPLVRKLRNHEVNFKLRM